MSRSAPGPGPNPILEAGADLPAEGYRIRVVTEGRGAPAVLIAGNDSRGVLFGIGRLMVPLPTPERLFKGGNILAGACKIIFPIVKGEGFTRMFFPAWLRTRLGII